MRQGRGPRRLLATLVAALVVVPGTAVLAAGLVEREAGRLTLAVAEASAGTRRPDGLLAGEIRAALALEVSGSAVLSRTARAAVLDVALEGLPLGRVMLLPDEGGGLDGPVRFEVDARAEAPSPEAFTAVTSRAEAEHPGSFLVEARGTLHLAGGLVEEVDVASLVPVSAVPPNAEESHAFAAFAGPPAGKAPPEGGRDRAAA